MRRLRYKRRAGTQQHLTYGFCCGPCMSGQMPPSTNSSGNWLNELCNVFNHHMNVTGGWLTCFLILELLYAVIRRSNIIYLVWVIFHDKKPERVSREIIKSLHFSRCTEQEWRANYNTHLLLVCRVNTGTQLWRKAALIRNKLKCFTSEKYFPRRLCYHKDKNHLLDHIIGLKILCMQMRE